MSINKKIVSIITALTVSVFLFGAAAVPSAQALTAEELQAQIVALNAQLAALQAQLGTAGSTVTGSVSVDACSGITFSRNLALGSSGTDVKCLQALLNQSADTQVAVTGAGSPGSESTYFGNLTKAAVIKFQVKYAADCLTPIGLTQGTGFVGSMTRAKLNAMLAGGVVTGGTLPAGCTSNTGYSVTTGLSCAAGTLPAGCTSNTGYSPLTGVSCASGGTVLYPVSTPTASLSANTPGTATIPAEASKVALLSVNLQAAITDVNITGLTFRRAGVGATTDWAALYLYVDGIRVTTYGRTISVDDNTVEFAALNITIPAGQTKVVTLRGDVAAIKGGATAGDQSAFQLVSSNVSFAGLPITGYTMTISGVGAGTATITAGNTITNPAVGAQQATVGSFKVTATNNSETKLSQVVLTITGTMARANITNIKLYFENTLLAEAAGVDNYDNAVLTLSTPFAIAKTLTKTFTIKADLGGRLDETILVRILENGDILATESSYGYGAIITGAPVTCGNLTLKGGTISLADNGPVVGKVSKQTQDVVITKFGMTSTRAVEVIRLGVALISGAAIIDGNDTTLVSDVRIKDTDTRATLMTGTLSTTATDTTGVVTMTGSFSLAANTTRNLEITVDLGNSATLDSTTIKGNLSMIAYSGTQVYIRDTVTGDYILTTEIIPSTVSGDNQTIEAAALNLLLGATPISQTVVTGATEVSAIGLAFGAGGGSDVTIRQIDANIYVASDVNFLATSTLTTREVVLLAKLYDGTTLLSQKTLTEAGTAGANAYGIVRFDSLNIPITKNTTKSLTIKVNTASNLTATRYVAIEVPTSTVDVVDPNSNTVYVGLTGANIVTLGATPSRYATIQTKGTLTLGLNAAQTPVTANVAVGGQNDGKAAVTLLSFDFTATDEDVKVTDIRVTETGGSTVQAYKAIYLYDGTTLVDGTGFVVGEAYTTFDNLSVIVPSNSKKTLTVKADLAGVDGAAVVTGDDVKVKVGTTTVLAIGVSSGETIDCVGADAEGLSQYVYKTAVEAKLASASPTGPSIKGGAQNVFYMDLSNIGSYEATFVAATFTIGYNPGTGGNATASSALTCSLYDSADLGTAIYGPVDCIALGDVISGNTFVVTPTTPLAIGAGATKTVILKFETSDVGSQGGAAYRFDIAAAGDLTWNDGNANVSARTRYLPITGGTLTY